VNNLNIYDMHFCVRRLPAKLRKMLMNHGKKIIIAGGYIRSIVAGERISDIDIFAGDRKTSEIFATELQGNDKFYRTDNAFTVTNLPISVQFIFRWVYDQPIEVLNSFDFTICQAAIWFDHESKIWDSVCGDWFYQDVAAKRLTYLSPIRNEDAGGSILRVLKYYQRGYRIPLDSFGAVITRLIRGIDLEKIWDEDDRIQEVITGLLFEVDPNAFINHEAYLPSKTNL